MLDLNLIILICITVLGIILMKLSTRILYLTSFIFLAIYSYIHLSTYNYFIMFIIFIYTEFIFISRKIKVKQDTTLIKSLNLSKIVTTSFIIFGFIYLKMTHQEVNYTQIFRRIEMEFDMVLSLIILLFISIFYLLKGKKWKSM